MKRVTFLNSNDKMGQRFSGIDWFPKLFDAGWDSRMLVGHRPASSDPRVAQTTRLSSPSVISTFRAIEIYRGKQNSFSPFGRLIERHEFIVNADILHFQVMHDLGWFRHEDIFKFAKNKPSVWTWHDAWNVTGHCIQPLDCEQFKKNCRTCPHLDWDLPIAVDRAMSEKTRKSDLMTQVHPAIHVSTIWMKNLVEKSPGFESTQVEVIPFGLDLDKYNKRGDKDSRKKYGINENALVIGFRSTNWNVKNLDLILQTLPKLSELNREIVVMTVDEIGNIDRVFNSDSPFRLIELGWADESGLLDFYNCLDVLLAVSTGESFGFMPLEANAFGVSVICLKDTAIAELVSKSEPDMVISNRSDSLLTSLKKLSEECDTERALRNRKILEVVQKDYDLNLFVTRLTKLYEDQIEKWGKHAHK